MIIALYEKYNMEVAVLKKLVTVLGAFFLQFFWLCPFECICGQKVSKAPILQYLYGFAFPLQGFCYVLQ